MAICSSAAFTALAKRRPAFYLSREMLFLRSTRPLPALLAILSVIMALACSPARAQEPGSDQMAFDIPSQPLDGALTHYFQTTGVQLLYDSNLTLGRRSTTVRGRYARRDALRRLLAGTGLIVRYSRANAAIITTPSGGAGEGPLIPLGRVVVRERITPARLAPVDRMAYYGRLEAELQSYLRGDRRTGRLAFNIVVEFRVGSEGRLRDLRVSKGSGDRKIDLTVSDALRSAIVATPPDMLDQPLKVALKGARR